MVGNIFFAPQNSYTLLRLSMAALVVIEAAGQQVKNVRPTFMNVHQKSQKRTAVDFTLHACIVHTVKSVYRIANSKTLK